MKKKSKLELLEDDRNKFVNGVQSLLNEVKHWKAVIAFSPIVGSLVYEYLADPEANNILLLELLKYNFAAFEEREPRTPSVLSTRYKHVTGKLYLSDQIDSLAGDTIDYDAEEFAKFVYSPLFFLNTYQITQLFDRNNSVLAVDAIDETIKGTDRTNGTTHLPLLVSSKTKVKIPKRWKYDTKENGRESTKQSIQDVDSLYGTFLDAQKQLDILENPSNQKANSIKNNFKSSEEVQEIPKSKINALKVPMPELYRFEEDKTNEHEIMRTLRQCIHPIHQEIDRMYPDIPIYETYVRPLEKIIKEDEKDTKKNKLNGTTKQNNSTAGAFSVPSLPTKKELVEVNLFELDYLDEKLTPNEWPQVRKYFKEHYQEVVEQLVNLKTLAGLPDELYQSFENLNHEELNWTKNQKEVSAKYLQKRTYEELKNLYKELEKSETSDASLHKELTTFLDKFMRAEVATENTILPSNGTKFESASTDFEDETGVFQKYEKVFNFSKENPAIAKFQRHYRPSTAYLDFVDVVKNKELQDLDSVDLYYLLKKNALFSLSCPVNKEVSTTDSLDVCDDISTNLAFFEYEENEKNNEIVENNKLQLKEKSILQKLEKLFENRPFFVRAKEKFKKYQKNSTKSEEIITPQISEVSIESTGFKYFQNDKLGELSTKMESPTIDFTLFENRRKAFGWQIPSSKTLRYMSGTEYIDEVAPDNYTFNKGELFPFESESYKYTLERSARFPFGMNAKVTPTHIDKEGRQRYTVFLDPFTNDVILDNPFILGAVVRSLQTRTLNEDQNYTMYGGTQIHEDDYQMEMVSPAPAEEDNIYMRALDERLQEERWEYGERDYEYSDLTPTDRDQTPYKYELDAKPGQKAPNLQSQTVAMHKAKRGGGYDSGVKDVGDIERYSSRVEQWRDFFGDYMQYVPRNLRGRAHALGKAGTNVAFRTSPDPEFADIFDFVNEQDSAFVEFLQKFAFENSKKMASTPYALPNLRLNETDKPVFDEEGNPIQIINEPLETDDYVYIEIPDTTVRLQNATTKVKVYKRNLKLVPLGFDVPSAVGLFDTPSIDQERFYEMDTVHYRRLPKDHNWPRQHTLAARQRFLNLFNGMENELKPRQLRFYPVMDDYRWLWLGLSRLSLGLFLARFLKGLYITYSSELAFYLKALFDLFNIRDSELLNILDPYSEQEHIRVFVPGVNYEQDFNQLAGKQESLFLYGHLLKYLGVKCRRDPREDPRPLTVLFTGPPGTGKTLLVKAIGHTANVPVIILSGHAIIEAGEGPEKLIDAFEKARQLSPCILFIDEMDTIGEKRPELTETALQHRKKFDPYEIELTPDYTLEGEDLELEEDRLALQRSHEKIHTLTELLVQLDGIAQRRNFLLIGATNRREVLDPALIRPGRFNEIINVGLPSIEKKVEMLVRKTGPLGTKNYINFENLAMRALSFSAADIDAMVNDSIIKSVVQNKQHTRKSLVRALKHTKNIVQPVKVLERPVITQSRAHIIPIVYYELARMLLIEKINEDHKKDTSLLISFAEGFGYDQLVNILNTPDNDELDIEFQRQFEFPDTTITEAIHTTVKRITSINMPDINHVLLWLVAELGGKAGEALYYQTQFDVDMSQIHAVPNLGTVDIYRANYLIEYIDKVSNTIHEDCIDNLEGLYFDKEYYDEEQSEDLSRYEQFKYHNIQERMREVFFEWDVIMADEGWWNDMMNWSFYFMPNDNKLVNWERFLLWAASRREIYNIELLYPNNFFSLIPTIGDETMANYTETILENRGIRKDLYTQYLLTIAWIQALTMMDEVREDLDRIVYLHLRVFFPKLNESKRYYPYDLPADIEDYPSEEPKS